jgi:hypothetical protein
MILRRRKISGIKFYLEASPRSNRSDAVKAQSWERSLDRCPLRVSDSFS